jgi:hypothetical protein
MTLQPQTKYNEPFECQELYERLELSKFSPSVELP